MSQEAEELHAKADGKVGQSERIATTTRALHDERRRWRRWFDAAPAAYLLTNAYGAIQEANLRAAVLVGVPPRFLRGKPLPALVAPQDRARVRRLLVTLARDTASGGAANDPAVEVELHLPPARRAAGPPLAVRASVGAVRDERGKLLGVAWMLQVPIQPSAPLPSPGRRRGSAWRAQAEPRRLLEATIEATPTLLRVDAAGLLLVEPNGLLRPAVATDPGIAALEALQIDLDEGPALEAARRLETVSIRDLGVDRRWRRLGWVAADHQVRALLAVPVLADEDRPDDTVAAGVVELVIHSPHRWTGEEVRAAVAHGATLSRLLRAGLAAGQANERLSHLLRVLDSRVVVEQAKGMLMERDRLLPAQAFQSLRAMAKLSNRRISDVAADVIADRAR